MTSPVSSFSTPETQRLRGRKNLCVNLMKALKQVALIALPLIASASLSGANAQPSTFRHPTCPAYAIVARTPPRFDHCFASAQILPVPRAPHFSGAQMQTLRERIKEMPNREGIKTDPEPPLPDDDINCIQRDEAHEFLRLVAAHSPSRAAEIDQMLGSTLLLSHEDFEGLLYEAIGSFNQEIGKEKYSIVTNQGKSNEWVAQLSLKYLANLPVDIIDDASYMPKVSHFAFIDDAAYSCTQIARTVEVFIYAYENIRPLGRGIVPHIHLILPLMSERNCVKQLVDRKHTIQKDSYRMHVHAPVEFDGKVSSVGLQHKFADSISNNQVVGILPRARVEDVVPRAPKDGGEMQLLKRPIPPYGNR